VSKSIARDARPDVALLLRLVDQSVWANRRWIDHVYTLPGADARARGLLAHIVLGECIWFERIAGGQKTPSTFQELEEDELLTRLENNRRDYLRLIETRLDEVVEFRRDTGVEYHATVSDALLHLTPASSRGSSPPTTRAGRSPTPAPTTSTT
jgi:uncharacterized damage-inducible protein DinB